MPDVIAKICSIPKDFHFHKNKSLIRLLNESGYLKEKSLVTKELLATHIAAHPDLIEDWENYSSDKRVSEGWYFLKENSKWVVGYAGASNHEQRFVFSSEFEACAEFILREVIGMAARAGH